MKSLKWLRGGLPSVKVKKEFNSIERYYTKSILCQNCEENDKLECEHNTLSDRLSDALKLNSRRSIFLAVVCFFVTSTDSYVATRPFFVQIFLILEVPLKPKWTAVNLSCLL